MTKISDFPTADPLDGSELVPVIQFGLDTVTTIDELAALLSEQIEASVGEIKKAVTTPQSNSAAPTTPTAVTELTQVLAPGTYRLEGVLIWQAAATGTGIQFYINCSGGTVSRVVMEWTYTTTATSGATGVVDGATAAGSQLIEGKSQRTNNTATGHTAGVDTANSDVIGILDAVVTVTAETTFQLMFTSSAASANVVQDGTNILFKKVA